MGVALPNLREGSYCSDWLLERRHRAEAAPTWVVAACSLLAVSRPRMGALVQSLGRSRAWI